VSPPRRVAALGGRSGPANGRRSGTHRSPALLLAVPLATVTALALLWSAATLTRPPAALVPSAQAADDANAEVVRRFYDAANRVLRTGDAAALGDVVAPAGGDGALAGYLATLAGLRAACPDCVLDAETIVVAGEWAAARVVARGSAPPTFLGLPLAGPPVVWTAHDLVRIAAGTVAEVRSQADPIAAVCPLAAEVAVPTPAGPVIVQVAHLTLQPGARLAFGPAPGPVLVAAEAGTLALGAVGSDAGGDDRPAALGAGDAVVLAAGGAHELVNQGAVPGDALAVAIFPLAASDPARAILTPVDLWRAAVGDGVAIRLVGSGMALVPGGTARLSAGWLDLPAGAAIGAHAAGKVEVIAVAAGAVALTATSPDLRLAHTELLEPAAGHLTAGDARVRGQEAVLEAGEAASVHGGTVHEVRGRDGRPARLLLVRLVPD
jgi:predicted ester cyclase